jgi:spermidine synthase
MSHFFEIFRAVDQWGQVHVMSDSSNYYLTFGSGGQQSGMQVNQPDRLLFQYTQAMMLSLLFTPKAKSAILLGLGAGSIAKSLLVSDDKITLIAVELRQKVKEIAHQWFYLPETDRLEVKIDDAFKFIKENKRTTDLVFVDLYLDNGIQKLLSSADFIQQCYDALNNNGTLVLNLWDEGKGYLPFDLDLLEETFTSQALMLVTDESNIIVIIGKNFQADPHPRKLQSEAKKLGAKLDIPLQRLLNQLQVRC